MIEGTDFTQAIARCLAYPELPTTQLSALVQAVLAMPAQPDRDALEDMQRRIDATAGTSGSIGLVYGGATKIKDYVFEASKLPEIRGASALLDWVNERTLPALWGATLGDDPQQNRIELTRCGIVYASGGNILAFAPLNRGQELADAIEQSYSDWTLTANSAAVSAGFSLLELRYGRNPLAYWVEEFLKDWRDETRRNTICSYYALDAKDTAEIAQRAFFARKNFSELVTILAGTFYRCREERPYDPRSFYALQPWDSRCQSSGTRPAVVKTPTIGDELEGREMSEASARKRFVGQVFKREIDQDEARDPTRWFWRKFDWNKPEGVSSWRDWSQQQDLESWEQRWVKYLAAYPASNYARAAVGKQVRSARDVQEIGASSGRYIGMIYADGNRMGRFFSRLPTPEAYARASHTIAAVLKGAVFDALSTYLEPSSQKPVGAVHPFEILTIGGDDLLLIVPANRALDIAIHIGHAFESNEQIIQLTNGVQPATPRVLADRYAGRAIDPRYDFAAYTPDLSLSTGVVLAQENAPIFFLRELADELIKTAKKKAKDQAEGGGTVDFMVLKAVTMVTDNIAEFRKRALDAQSSRRLIARPYTWHELAGLLVTARKLREARVPRSQLYRLREVLDQQRHELFPQKLSDVHDPEKPVELPQPVGILASSIEYLYTRARMDRPRDSAVLEHVELSWRGQHTVQVGAAPIGSSAPPWLRRDSHSWETIWHDLVEIYDMLA